MTKRKSKSVRRSKAAEGNAVDALDRPRSRSEQTLGTSQVAGASRAPSPLDELLSDLHLREPVAREPWLIGIERALSKFVGELNECERFETSLSPVRSPLCN